MSILSKKFSKQMMPKVAQLWLVCWGLVLMGILNAAQAGDLIAGQWQSPDKDAILEIKQQGDQFSGTLIQIRDPNALDAKNPDKNLQSRKLLGLAILTGLKFNADEKEWQGGRIYDPKTGKTYKCKAWIEDGNLHMRGFIGVALVGRTAIWTRK